MNFDQIYKTFILSLAAEIKKTWDVVITEKGINEKTGTNTLKGSKLHLQQDLKGAGEVFEFIVNDYIQYVESGRRPRAKKVPINVLERWIADKHLKLNAWAVQEQIYRDGIKPRPLMYRFFEIIEKQNIILKSFENLLNRILDNNILK